MSRRCLKGCLVVALLAMSGAGAAPGRTFRWFDAVKDGDTAAVRGLLDKGGDVNAAEVDGTTVLHWAVHHDYVDVTDLLIRAGRQRARRESVRRRSAFARVSQRKRGNGCEAAASRRGP